MFCLSLEPSHLQLIKKLGYIPVGLGKKNFSKEWLRDNTEKNIASKNQFYGEYTFHYWVWKNYLDKIENNWIGFCQYRKFWTVNKIETENIDFNTLQESVLNEIPKKYDNFESIIGEPFYVNQFRFSKFIKRNLKTMVLNPALLFDKNKRTLKFHFDMWHGHGNLAKAINLLDNEDRNDFDQYMNTNVSFNPHNMFVCKSKIKLKEYYEVVFPWLERCENEFGFENLKGYGLQRIYGFLAERFMSYWFKKNTKYMTLPIYFKDISDY
ncbi:DUF4422 domain-containing protein [Pelagibacteraceae bacterium]|nr:DUF4422 domain-containing protein [Pelagibacteraceae bacterium]